MERGSVPWGGPVSSAKQSGLLRDSCKEVHISGRFWHLSNIRRISLTSIVSFERHHYPLSTQLTLT